LYLYGRKQPFHVRFKKQAVFHMMIWIGIIFVFVFNYIPMSGIIIAFKNYNFKDGILGSSWAGFKHFQTMFSDFFIADAAINTLGISLLTILLSFPSTIIFTLLLNELFSVKLKRFIQTVSYLPYFISWVVMAVILDAMLSPANGAVNLFLTRLGIVDRPIAFLADESLYWIVVVVSTIWKNLGWNTIVYLAVIAGIDENLFEAAKIDGAGRLARIRYIILPALSGVIAIMLILFISNITGVGFEQAFFLYNPLNATRSNTLSYYVYTIGLRRADFSYSTAISLLLSCVSAVLMIMANTISKKLSGKGLF